MLVETGGRCVFVHGTASGDGPPVLLLHGAGGDHSTFRFLTRALANRGFRALAPDLPGHGASPPPAANTIEEMAEVTATLVAALDLNQVGIIGYSMGSLVGLELASSRPDLVGKLMLVATSGTMAVNPGLLEAAEQRSPRAVDMMVDWIHRGADQLGGHPQPGSWSRGITRRLLERALRTGTLAVDLRACAAYPGAERAPKVTCPTLVLVGAADVMTPPEAGAALASAIPGAELVELPGAGHGMVFDRPGELLELAASFLRP